MNAAPLDTLKEIFHSARELPPNERPAFLDHACGADEQLRREVEQLLESDRQADGFIDKPPAQLAAELFGARQNGSDAGRVVGQYRLIECIGSGGMGAVYLAERADQQFQMRVAVKLIKRGMDTDAVLRRFHAERQILASLEHPNIARLLDGGTTDDGLPYFVMEYVEGERIDTYASNHDLSVADRLKMFQQVCGAVSYAHQRLVIHRDLKPSNILVTREGVPKLLDFGIAKLIDPAETGDAFATLTVMPAMTPAYASPEQIEGTHATTSSDVYSLGAVLYELLTGRPPYQLPNRSPQAVAKAIETGLIEKPSAVVNRAEDARHLRGDLDNIVLMAMRRDSIRRYRSVEQFSEDIRRYLEGRPVIARRDTLSYRAGKFVQRNKLGVAAAALLLLSLIGGILATGWQAHKARLQERRARFEQARAERRFNDVRKLANNVLFDYHDAIKDLPGATKVRERLVKDALNYLDSLAGEAHDDPHLQRELAAAYERVGDVLGGAAGGNLGDVAAALESYGKSLRIRTALLAQEPNGVRARRDFASSHAKIGNRLLDTGKMNDGFEHLQKARALYLRLTREQPNDDELQLDLANTCNWLGRAMVLRNDLPGALEQDRAAVAISEAHAPHDVRYRRALWNAYEEMATVLFLQADLAGAIEVNTKALALGESLIAEDPVNADYRRGLAQNYKNGADYRMRSDTARAAEYYRKAAGLEEELLAADPADASIRTDLGKLHKSIADIAANAGENSEALLQFRKAVEIFERLSSDAPLDLTSRFKAATCRAGLAGMQARLGDVVPALEECRHATAILGGISEDPAHTQNRYLRAEADEYLGFAYFALAESPKASVGERRDHMTAARDHFRQSLDIIDGLRRNGTLDPYDEKWAKEIAAEIAKCSPR